MSNRADQWRKKKQEQMEREAVTLRLPSGAEVLAARLPLDSWLMTGRVPQVFVGEVVKMMEDGEKPNAAKILERVKGASIFECLRFMADVVRESVVSPRIVERPRDGEDEIAASEVSPQDFAFVFTWAINGAPDIPVKLDGASGEEGGQTTMDALTMFPPRGPGFDPGADQSKVRRPPKRKARHP